MPLVLHKSINDVFNQDCCLVLSTPDKAYDQFVLLLKVEHESNFHLKELKVKKENRQGMAYSQIACQSKCHKWPIEKKH